MPRGKMLRFVLALNTRPCKESKPGSQGQGVLGVATPSSAPEEIVSKPTPTSTPPICPGLYPLPSATPAGQQTMRVAGARRGGGTEMTQNHIRPHLLNPAVLHHSPPATPGWRFRLDTEMGGGGGGAASCPPPSD